MIPRTPKRGRLLSRRFTYFSLALVAFGLLLWARLILVTGRPRMAIADPDKQQQALRPATAQPASPNEPLDGTQATEPTDAESAAPSERVPDKFYSP